MSYFSSAQTPNALCLTVACTGTYAAAKLWRGYAGGCLSSILEKTYQDFFEITELDKSVVVINDFLKRPDAALEMALGQEYKQDKVYPGERTPKWAIEGPLVRILERYIGEPVLRVESVFQIQSDSYEKHSFVHGDLCDWAAVLYLNKGHDGTPGTSFYRHKETGMDKLALGAEMMFLAIERGVQPQAIVAPPARDRFDLDKWDVTLTVPIQFNRLVLYNAKLFHRNASAWGTCVRDSRLVQGFFISTSPANGPALAGVDVLEREGAARSV